MIIREAIESLEKQIPNPSSGLPLEVFYFISRITPLVNADLLIKDEKERTLLSWRDERHTGKGWHLPGGIVRFQETLEARVRKVAEKEVGAAISFENTPLALSQIINNERKIRGHFVSILYKCFLSSSFIPPNKGISMKDNGFLKWHDSCPDNLLKVHEIYRKYI